MKRVTVLFVCFLLVLMVSSVPAYALYEEEEELYIDEEFVLDGLEGDNFEEDKADIVDDSQSEFYNDLLALFDERFPLGVSSVEPEEQELPEPPPIHELMPSVGISPMSIGTQTAYPYTGGAFMALNTNYGNGLLVSPEPFKVDTFGFVKGTNRPVNLTNSTITCYWIMGGTTYNARVQRYMEPEYAYVSGSTTTWRTLTVSALTDSNIQFLDETGERGIQRPYMSLETKIILFFVVFIGLIQLLSLFKGR